jgi:hypothetical protein
MSEGKPSGGEPKADGQSRRARQAEALRANLRKRKARQRSRLEAEASAPEPVKKPDCNQS